MFILGFGLVPYVLKVLNWSLMCKSYINVVSLVFLFRSCPLCYKNNTNVVPFFCKIRDKNGPHWYDFCNIRDHFETKKKRDHIDVTFTCKGPI